MTAYLSALFLLVLLLVGYVLASDLVVLIVAELLLAGLMVVVLLFVCELARRVFTGEPLPEVDDYRAWWK